MAPEKLPGDDSLFLYHFFVDSMKGDAQKKTEKEKRTRKHLQHKKNCWNWQNSSLCVLCLVILYIFWKNWNTKGPMRVWRQLALEAERDVTTSRSSGLAGYLAAGLPDSTVMKRTYMAQGRKWRVDEWIRIRGRGVCESEQWMFPAKMCRAWHCVWAVNGEERWLKGGFQSG